MEIWRRLAQRRHIGKEALLEAQSISAVLIIAAPPPELAISALAIARDCRVIGLMHFESHDATTARQRSCLRRREQPRGEPAPGRVGSNRNRVEACHPGARTEQGNGEAG